MLKKRQIIFLKLLLLIPIIVHSQVQDSLVFSKNRMITSLFGSISNQKVNIASEGSVNTIGYTLGTKSGIFIKDNWALGLNFSLSKSDYKNTDVNFESENLLLGLWSRLYFAQKGGAVLFAELTPFYTAVNRQNTIFDNGGTLITDEEALGAGFGLQPGFGFTYIIDRNVGFGIALSYSMARLEINTVDKILENSVTDNFDVFELQFSFNFQIYLDQFFF